MKGYITKDFNGVFNLHITEYDPSPMCDGSWYSYRMQPIDEIEDFPKEILEGIHCDEPVEVEISIKKK